MSSIDARSIGLLLVAEYRPLIRYAQRLTANGPEAADLVHTVFMRVLAQGGHLEAPSNMAAWLRTVLFRVFVDLRRRAQREILTEVALLERPPGGVDLMPPALHIDMDDVRAMIPSLPNHYREPYELYTFEHLSYDRIAVRLGLSSKTVGTRINRARRKLRVLLEDGPKRGT